VKVKPRKWEHYGVRGEKLIVLVDYRTHSNDSGHASVFVKLQGEPCGAVGPDGHHEYPSPVEACHYHWLAQHGAPIPQMFAAALGRGPEESDETVQRYQAAVFGVALARTME